MFPETYRTDVSRAVCSFLLAGDRAERMRVPGAAPDLLLRDEADGFLAAALAMYQQNLPFRDAVEALRLCLDEARHSGYDGGRRELAGYLADFDAVYQDGAPIPALAESGDDPVVSTAAGGVVAFAVSGSWRARHRIVVAFGPLFATGTPAELCEQVAPLAGADDVLGDQEFWSGLAAVLRRVHADGPDVLLRGELTGLFPPVHPSPDQPILLTTHERLRLAVLAFADAPTWELRGRVAARNPELLTPAAAELLEAEAGQAGAEAGQAGAEADHAEDPSRAEDHSRADWLALCLRVLAQARAEGLAVFDGPLPPTGMRRDPAADARLRDALTAGDAAAAAGAARQFLHRTDPVLAPRRWAAWNRRLARLLLDVAEPALRAACCEEAIGRIRDALGVYGYLDDPASYLHCLTLYGTILADRSRGDRASSLAAARACLEAARRGFAERGDQALAADCAARLAAVLGSSLPSAS